MHRPTIFLSGVTTEFGTFRDAAEKLIYTCGYRRRDEELADAKAALLQSPPSGRPTAGN